jgi:uncharacterized protein YvpB
MGRSILRRLAALLCLSGLLFAAGPPGVWLDVPYIRQPKEGCGAASIAMVMQYWSQQQKLDAPVADVAQIQRELHSVEGHGIYSSDVGRYFQEHGFRVVMQSPERWDNLRAHLEKGRPLVVALKPLEGKWLHYVVVVGMDWEQNIVMLNDPAQRKLLKQDRASFEKEWGGVNNWTLLALPSPPSH